MSEASQTDDQDLFNQAIEAHVGAMISGTQRYFERVGVEVNAEDIRQELVNAVHNNSVHNPMPQSIHAMRRNSPHPLRRTTSPQLNRILGPYSIPWVGLPLRSQDRPTPSNPPSESPSYPTAFGWENDLLNRVVSALPAIPEDARDHMIWSLPATHEEHVSEFSPDEICSIFDGGPEYDSETNCTVCLDELGQMTTETRHVELPCKHRFHTECLKGWLKEHRNCPVCRSTADIQT